MKSPETIIFVAFAFANVCRLLAYLPQILILLRQSDAAAVSPATWSLFAVSNGITAVYAARIVNDTAMALTFAANTICCASIVALVLYKSRKIRGACLPPSTQSKSKNTLANVLLVNVVWPGYSLLAQRGRSTDR